MVVSGTAVDAVHSKPLEGVTLTIEGYEVSARSVSSGDFRATVGNLQRGDTLQVRLTKPGYHPKTQLLVVDRDRYELGNIPLVKAK
jgi:hypothetical protein